MLPQTGTSSAAQSLPALPEGGLGLDFFLDNWVQVRGGDGDLVVVMVTVGTGVVVSTNSA